MIYACIDLFSGLNLRDSISGALSKAGIAPDVYADDMCTFLLAGRASSTQQKYMYAFKAFKRFAVARKFPVLPTTHMHVAVYVTDLLTKKRSASVVSNAVYALKWAHKVSGFEDPTVNTIVTSLLESGRRKFGRPTVKKDVVTSDVIISLCSTYAGSSDLLVVRNLCMIVVAFSAFLRYDELCHVKISDLTFEDGYFTIMIRKAKTDQ